MVKQYEVLRAFSTDGENYFTRGSTQESLKEIPADKADAFVKSGSLVIHEVDAKVLADAPAVPKKR